MREVAVSYLGTSIDNAVVTVPVYFNDAQRQDTKNREMAEASENYLLRELQFTDLPHAPCGDLVFSVCFEIDMNGVLKVSAEEESTKKKNVMTINVCNLSAEQIRKMVNDNERYKLEDEEYKKKKRQRSALHMYAHEIRNAIREKGIRANISYSEGKQIENGLEEVFTWHSLLSKKMLSATSFGHGKIEMRRKKKRGIEKWQRHLKTIERCLEDAKMEKSSIHDIILVGGWTRIPMIQQLLTDFFDDKKHSRSINPNEVVAYGAAIEAAKLNGDDNKKLHLPHAPCGDLVFSVCFEIDMNDVLKVSAEEESTKKKNVMTIKVCNLSAEQIRKMVNDNERYKLEDEEYRKKKSQRSSLHMYAHEIRNAIREKGICANISYSEGKQIEDGLEEGEMAEASENYLLGELQFTDLPHAPCGDLVFSVCFEIDMNGVLKVSAEKESTKKKNVMTINVYNLSTEQIRKMVNDNERYKLEYEEYRKKKRQRSALHMYAHEIRNAIREKGISANISYSEGKQIEDGLEEVFTWLKENSDAEVGETTDKMKKLKSIWEAIDH
ncbi:Heat shock protein 3 [Nymphaea thermarum]|nr:Heat shock protein 3 [Nymphaea thermarum]